MSRVTISPKFQIVTPRETRERLRLRTGQQITLFERDGSLTAIPNLPFEKFRRILKGMSRTQDLALRAADLSLEFSLPMADSSALATA